MHNKIQCSSGAESKEQKPSGKQNGLILVTEPTRLSENHQASAGASCQNKGRKYRLQNPHESDFTVCSGCRCSAVFTMLTRFFYVSGFSVAGPRAPQQGVMMIHPFTSPSLSYLLV